MKAIAFASPREQDAKGQDAFDERQAITGANSAMSGMRAAFPVMAAVFLSFLIIGMALPVLPLHVHDRLGFGPFIIGIVAGGQFLASLVSRLWAGRLTDRRGAKRAVVLGLFTAIAGGASYLASLLLLDQPAASVGVLLVGRTLLGAAESLIITGGMLWGLGLVARERGAKVIAWVGMSMFAAMAIGAPIGSVVYGHWNFRGIAALTAALPAAALLMIAPLKPLLPVASQPADIRKVISAVMLPGLGFALSGITFGSVTAFLTLYFATQGWANGALAFSIFAAALILVRVFAGQLPDRFGGARVAFVSLIVQAAGLALIGFAPRSELALAGAALSGAGFSLVFPSLGIEAVRRAPIESRGLAMGMYNAFLDLTLGLGSPLLGLLATHANLSAVFIASALSAVLALPIAVALKSRTRAPATAT